MAQEFQPSTEDNSSHVWKCEWDASPLPADSAAPQPVAMQDLFGDGRALVLRHVLTPAECAALIAQSEAAGYEPTGYDPRYRSNERVVVRCDDLARQLFARVAPFVPATWAVEDAELEAKCGFDSAGRWEAVGANECVRFCRYDDAAHFGPHYDGQFTRDEENRSFFTLMCYLNGGDDFAGGATNFLNDDQPLYANERGQYVAEPGNVTVAVRPEPGLCLVFFHPQLHEGERVRCAPGAHKYIMRSEVMFRRDPATRRQKTPQELEAAECLRRAERLEGEGQVAEAAKQYSRAFRLDPRLADALKS